MTKHLLAEAKNTLSQCHTGEKCHQGSIYWKISIPLGGGGREYQPMSFGGKKYVKVKRKRGKM
jgi:hypothetical protein